MATFAQTLLRWYSLHKRTLPWRDIADPYKIWISEIILQQTRVAQGYDYFVRFVKRFPDVKTLAAAPQDEVLKYWEGLGYYSRARNLHAAAQSMKSGVFPRTYEEVRALKGVGDYTAAAICSFAYQMPYAVVDGNVQRVLARIFGLETPVDSTAGKKEITALAQKLLDQQNPGDFNQAIMDFGATQCTPQAPGCLVCPFARQCVALQTGAVERLPVRGAKTKIAYRYFSYIYVKQGRDVWIHRRDGQDIWRGLYELPLLETAHAVTEKELRRLPQWRALFGTHSPRPLGKPVKHVLSHRIIQARFYGVDLPEKAALPAGFIRVPEGKLKGYAFPRLIQKFLEK